MARYDPRGSTRNIRLLFHGRISVGIGGCSADDADVDWERAIEKQFLAADINQLDKIVFGAFVDFAPTVTRIYKSSETYPGEMTRPLGGDVAYPREITPCGRL